MESGEGGTPSGSGGIVDNVQKALDDLRSAGEKATGDVRSQIDDAIARLRDATGDVRSQAQDQIGEWRQALESATEDMRKELAKLAVRAQTNPEALKEIEAEAKARQKALK
jgi:acyl-CoA reductase-like NAD-dependent aldehyde dehydrogenase